MSDNESTPNESSFEKQAQRRSRGTVREFFDLLRREGRWFLTPIILGLLVLGVLVTLSGTSVAPFIYALF